MISTAWFLACIFFAGTYYAYGARTIGLGLLFLSAGIPGTTFWLYRTKSFTVPTHWITGYLIAAVTMVSYFNGGIDPSTLMYLNAAPLMVVFLIGPRAGFLWFGISSAVVVVFYLMAANGYPFPEVVVRRPPGLEVLGYINMMGLVLLFTGVHQHLKNAALRRLEEKNTQLFSARKAAEAASKAKSDFLANMSHEIRTPMNGVVGVASLLGETELNEEQREYVRTIERSSATLLALISDVLDLSKIEAGQLLWEQVSFSLDQLLHDIIQLFEGQARKKGIKLELRVEIDQEKAVGDPVRLKQILLNLLGNALKFTDKGTVQLRALRDGEQVRFEVEDTGIGIQQDALAGLFAPFCQADASTTRKYGGTGLGLTISRNLALLMGGTLEVESEVDVGSRFVCTVPLPIAQSTLEHLPVTEEPSVAPLHVLIVDDNVVNRTVTAKILEHLGCSHEMACDGEEAISIYESGAFDAVLMDCQMPKIDGFRATAILRERGFKVPIIALTANALAEDRQRCLDAGMDDYLSKPLRKAELASVLHRNSRKRPSPKAQEAGGCAEVGSLASARD